MPTEPPAPSPPISALERYHILRDQIQHEDNLITQRLAWLMASQAFLFSAYAILLNAPERAMSAFARQQQEWLITAIPALAVGSAALIYVSILAGVRALHHLHVDADRICGRAAADSALPPIQGTAFTRLAGLTSPLLVPPLFIGVWLFLTIRGLLR
jgi:hypothetical protein